MKIKLGEALRYEQPTKYIVASEKYNDSYATPVLTAGKSFILGYTNEESGIYDNLPVIIFDDFTTDIKYVDFPFKVKSSAMKMLQPANENYNLKFFYYLIKYMNFQPTSHQRHWISKFAEMEFDIPERVKQDQIVEKLDKLVEMQSKKTIQLKKYDDLVKSKVYVIDINDTITDNGNRAGVNIAGMKTYEQKVIDYLAENSNKEVIKKIKNLEKINENDLHELESILWSELGTKEDYFKFTQKDNLAVFVRSIVGLEQQAVNEKFGQFLTENVLNSRQQEFVKTIISYVRENGDVTFDDLVNNSPFDNINIIRMFGDKIYIVQKIVEQLHGAVMCA